MAHNALFSGLVIDEGERPVQVTHIGGEAFYVVDDDGFHRHIPSEQVDLQVLGFIKEMIEGHEELISEETMKMLGQEDIFTKAMIESSLKNVDEQFAEVIARGIPEGAKAWLGMLGFQVVIDIHGEVVRVVQPGENFE